MSQPTVDQVQANGNSGGTSGGTSNRIESSESESTPIDTVHFGIFHDQVQTEVQKLQSSVSAINGAVGELSKTFSKYGNIVTTVGERYEKDQELEEKIQELEVSNNRIWKNILQDRAKYDKDMANQEREYEAKLSTLQAQADAGEQEKRKYVEMERQLEEQHNKAKQKMSRDLQRKTIQLESENAERITNLEKEITELQSDKARVRQELVQRIQERDGEKELRETMQTKLRADVKALEKALTDIKAKYEVEQQPSQFYEGRYKGVIDQVGHIATSYFTELSEKAIDDPVGTSNRLRRKGYNFAKIPIMISECSRVLRLAYVQHIIFGVLCGSMWQPMFSPYLWVHKKDKMSVLQEIYSGLAAEGEDVQHNWKVSTLKILDQRDEEVDVGMLMDELIDQVVSATEPLLDRDQLDPFRDDLKVVFADGMELARTAQQDRFPVCVETTPSVNDRTGWKEYSNEEFDVVDELPRSPTSDVHGESLFVSPKIVRRGLRVVPAAKSPTLVTATAGTAELEVLQAGVALFPDTGIFQQGEMEWQTIRGAGKEAAKNIYGKARRSSTTTNGTTGSRILSDSPVEPSKRWSRQGTQEFN